jgi:hypothetical protein
MPQMDSIYLVMVDRFENGRADNDGYIDPTDPAAFHGGDLAGVIEKLDFIETLGVDTLWLSPITKMRTAAIDGRGAFHGYWLENGRKLEPRFGTMAELETLRRGLTERGIGLILDQVLNNVGPDTPLLAQHPDWFHGRGDITDWEDAAQLRTHDVHGLPDLDHQKIGVVKHLVSDGLYWLNKASPTGFRIDSVRHIDPAFLKAWTRRLDANSETPLIFAGEINDKNPVRIAEMVAESGLTHSFDFPLHHALTASICKGGDLQQVAAVLTQDRRFEPGHQRITFLDNHNTPRLASTCGEQRQTALTWLTSLRGTPMITWGTAAGLTGTTAALARSDMVFDPTPMHAWIGARLDERRSYTPLVEGLTDILKATPDTLVVARVLPDEAVVIAMDETTAPPSLPEHAGEVQWIRISSTPVRRWLITPKSPSGFQGWVDHIQASEASTTPIKMVAASDNFISGSDPALGAWDTEKAVSPGEHTIALPTGGHVAVKTFKRGEDGEVIWSTDPNTFINVDAQAASGDSVKLGR